MGAVIGFIIGLVLGGCFGIMLLALLIAGKDD